MIDYIINYFSDWQHTLFWSLVLIACLYEHLKKSYIKRNRIKLWLKQHNIGKKYK